MVVFAPTFKPVFRPVVDPTLVGSIQKTVSTAIARFDEFSIVGTNPATEWQNRAHGGSIFDLDTVVGTAANLRVLESGVALHTGTAGDCFTSPDSTASSVTGDIDIRVRAASHAVGGARTICAKAKDNNNRSYIVVINDVNKLVLTTSPDGTAGNQVQELSTLAHSIPTGVLAWFRGTRDVDDGAGNNVTKFYTSTDDVDDSDDVTTWTQLGTTVTTVGTTSIVDNDSPVEIGSLFEGTIQLFNGKIARAQIYNGIDGTLAVDFDPSRFAVNASTAVMATGETFTANGDAFVNATQHVQLLDIGSVGIEVTTGQDIASPFTAYFVIKPILSAPGANQFLFDAKSDSAKSVRVYTDNANADKWTLDAGGTPIALSAAFSNDLQVITIQQNGDGTSKLTASGGSVTGNSGTEDLDFGSFLMDLSGGNTFPCALSESHFYLGSHSAGQVSQIQNFLGGRYGI